MAFATLQPNADPIIAAAFDGPPQPLNKAAPNFTLTNQYGHSVAFNSLRGKTVAVVGLDDVCTSDCPLVAQQLLSADRILGAAAKNVVMVAINLNPQYVQPVFLRAFDDQENLSHVPNWQFLTGSYRDLQVVWRKLAFLSEYQPGGSMILHFDEAYIVSATGRIRFIVSTDPGPATEATKSSLAVTLADAIETVASQTG
jgi:cytochrome oxidase Cu insertion factor (SCO1/SenC/PrrC family)